MRIVKEESDIGSAFSSAQSEALASFNDDRIYLEKFIEDPLFFNDFSDEFDDS